MNNSNFLFRLRNFFQNLRRAGRWFKFMMKLPYWNEYDNFIRIQCEYLKLMADEFDNLNYTATSRRDAKRMKLAARLLEMYLQEHYTVKIFESGNYDFKEMEKAYKKDEKCLKLAYKIITQELPGWWQ